MAAEEAPGAASAAALLRLLSADVPQRVRVGVDEHGFRGLVCAAPAEEGDALLARIPLFITSFEFSLCSICCCRISRLCPGSWRSA